jgi:hypothetical protein
MRVEPSKSAWRPGATETAEAAAWIAALGAVALWTAVIVRIHQDPQALKVGPTSHFVMVYGLPLVLAGLVVFDERLARNQALRVALLFAGAVLLAHVAANRIEAGSFGIVALPAVLIAAAVITRRPLIPVAVMIAMSGFYGDLTAYWQFPYQKTVQLMLGGLLIALIWRALVTGRDYTIRLTAGLTLMVVYLYATLLQTVLNAGNHAAWHGFNSSALYIIGALLIAVAGWRSGTQEKAAKILLVGIVAVGGYAVYRWIVGVSVQEFVFYGQQPFNYVGTKLKLLGSFPGGQDLGGWTASVIPFCLAMALTFRDRWRAIAVAAGGLCAVAMIGSQLRIAVPAVAFGALVVILLHDSARAFHGLRLGTTAAAIALVIAMGGVAYGVTGGSEDSSTHGYATLLHKNARRHDVSVTQRLYKWQTAVRDLRAHPFGYGMGSANANSFQYLPRVLSIGSFNVDNGYLRIALEQGFMLMILYGGMLIVLAIDLGRNSVRAPTPLSAGLAIGAAGTIVSFIVLLVAGAFEDGARAIVVWLIAGLGLAQFTTRRRASR